MKLWLLMMVGLAWGGEPDAAEPVIPDAGVQDSEGEDAADEASPETDSGQTSEPREDEAAAKLVPSPPPPSSPDGPVPSEVPPNAFFGSDEEAPVSYRWGFVPLPLVNYNDIDGLGFGAGVEMFRRRTDQTSGYEDRLSASTFWTTTLNYGSTVLQYERRKNYILVARLVHRLWKNMYYVGKGGRNVAFNWPDEVDGGNFINAPSMLINVSAPIKGTPVYIWGQAYARYVISEAKVGGILDQIQPFGVDGGFYFDVSTGVFLQEVDRWPMPHHGMTFEAGVRGGGTTYRPEGSESLVFEPLVGVYAKAVGWVPVAGEKFVIGMRTMIDKTWGERPYWEMENLGGQLRNEVGYEITLSGYGRSRTRGDGVTATMVELRPRLWQTKDPGHNWAIYLSGFGEVGWLFSENDPGPIMPSVGFAPILLFQQALFLRPFVSLGWFYQDAPGVGPRKAQTNLGISLLMPL